MTVTKKRILNIVFLIVVFLLTIYYVFKGQDLKLILEYTKNANWLYWIPSIIMVVLFIMCESFIIKYLAHRLGQKTLMTHCFIYSFVGFFFSCITPSASGGQPMQAAYMKKDGIPLSMSSVILMLIAITYKAVLIIIGVAVLVIRPTEIMRYLSPVIGWMYLGVALNIICVSVLFVLLFHPTLAKKCVMSLLHLANKLFHLKNIDQLEQKFENSLQKYHESAVYFKNNISDTVITLIITFAQRLILFFITYLVLLSFGVDTVGAFTAVTLQAMISVAVDMLPLPGGMGISESLFLSVFTPICGNTAVLPILIVNRGLSYYSELIISAVLTFGAHFIIKGDKNK